MKVLLSIMTSPNHKFMVKNNSMNTSWNKKAKYKNRKLKIITLDGVLGAVDVYKNYKLRGKNNKKYRIEKQRRIEMAAIFKSHANMAAISNRYVTYKVVNNTLIPQ